jgi:hypothetical protein
MTQGNHELTAHDQIGAGRVPTVRGAMTQQNPASPSRRKPRGQAGDPPATEALTRLLQAELAEAQSTAPALVAQCDPGRVWLLWFSIGATEEICRVTHQRADDERDQMFRHAVATVLGDGVKSPTSPSKAPMELIALFETAGIEAVRACMRGDEKLGFYLEALKAIWVLTE